MCETTSPVTVAVVFHWVTLHLRTGDDHLDEVFYLHSIPYLQIQKSTACVSFLGCDELGALTWSCLWAFKKKAMSRGIFSEGTASPHTSVYSLKHTTCTFWAKEINIFGELFGCHGKEHWTPSSMYKWPENYKRMCFSHFVALGGP